MAVPPGPRQADHGAPASQGLSARTRVGYAAGSLVTGSFGTVPGLLLLPYLTDTLGVAAGMAGLLVLLPKAWDVVVNPLAGRLSDRTHTRWGARRPYLLGAGLSLAVLFAAIFAGVLRGGAGAVWVCLAFLAAATAYAFFQVPYGAMAAELTESEHLVDPYRERTRVMTWRVAFLGLTILISGAVAPVVVHMFGNGVPGHRAMGLFIAALMVTGTGVAFLTTRDASTGRIHEHEATLRAQLRVAAANRPFRVLVVCFVTQAAGIAAMLAGVQYFAQDVLHQTDATSLLFVSVVVPAVLALPAWNRISTRMGKLRGYVCASLLITVTTFALVTAPWLPVPAVYGLVALLGVGYSGQQLFGLAMLPDCIAYDTARTGKRQAGVFTGLWTAGETLGLALGPGIFGLTLQLFGYVPSTSGVPAIQSPLADLGVLLGFTVIPGIVVGTALLFLRAYDLSAARLAGMDAPAVV